LSDIGLLYHGAMSGDREYSCRRGAAMAERTPGSTAVDRRAVEKEWRERGFSCGLRVDPPGQVWSDYVHDTDELVMVEGDVEFEIDGQVHRPAPGEELFIPARARPSGTSGAASRAGCTATGDDDDATGAESGHHEEEAERETTVLARQKELLGILKDRFERNAAHHPGLRWDAVQACARPRPTHSRSASVRPGMS